ncbi:MAG: Lrp/AsnC ligand binding domain-containing protein [Promethearchaeota archaeon]
MTLKLESFIKFETGNDSAIIDALKQIPEVSKILSITGDSDLLVEIISDKSEDLMEIIEHISIISGVSEIHSHYVMLEWEK